MTPILEVIYEDNHLLVVNKPAGLLTQPTKDEPNSLEALAKKWIKEKYNKPGQVFLHAVHRLDKPVSGIVIFARTTKALERLNEAMRSQHPRKIYLAIVEGTLASTANSVILEDYLVHDNHRARIVTKNDPTAKRARLSYRVLKNFTTNSQPLTLVEIQLETGRYHQIRIQFASKGYPILGDRKYGSLHPFQDAAIALHHSRLEIPHPITKEYLHFESKQPPHWPLETRLPH